LTVGGAGPEGRVVVFQDGGWDSLADGVMEGRCGHP